MGFSEDEWTQIHLVNLSPVVSGDGGEAGLVDEYYTLMERLQHSAPQVKKMRNELMGAQVILDAPQDYWKLVAREKLQLHPVLWESMTPYYRGQSIAYVQLSNMAETLRVYKQLLERNKEQELQAARKKPPKGKR